MKISPNDRCPCESGMKYKKCCRALHNGMPAPSPEALMRSRYTAYALDNVAYIMQTTHPEGPRWRSNPETWRTELEAFSRGTRFAGLQILAVEGDTVTFRATLFENIENGRDVSFTERSRFRQLEGRWLYVEGDSESPPTHTD